MYLQKGHAVSGGTCEFVRVTGGKGEISEATQGQKSISGENGTLLAPGQGYQGSFHNRAAKRQVVEVG